MDFLTAGSCGCQIEEQGMPFSRFAKMSQEKRERLLQVAAQEFAAHGYEAASLNRILEEAQLGKSSAYYYFEDKADLFCTVVDYCVSTLHLQPENDDVQSLTVETFWPAFAAAHDQPLQQIKAHPALFGAARAVDHLTEESLQREPLANLAHYMQEGMGAMIARGQALGLIRTDVPPSLLFNWFRAIDGATDDWLLAHLDELDEAAILQISHDAIDTIAAAMAPLSGRDGVR
jgi:AcrR family transcriptional regulator